LILNQSQIRQIRQINQERAKRCMAISNNGKRGLTRRFTPLRPISEVVEQSARELGARNKSKLKARAAVELRIRQVLTDEQLKLS